MVRLGAKRLGNRVSLPGTSKGFLSSPKHPDRLCNERIPTYFCLQPQV